MFFQNSQSGLQYKVNSEQFNNFKNFTVKYQTQNELIVLVRLNFRTNIEKVCLYVH